MHHPLRNDKQFTCFDGMRGSSLNIHRHFTFKNIEKIICLIMLMKRIFALKFYHHHFVLIIICNNMRVPMT